MLEYRGGTYISQICAAKPEDASLVWAESLDYRPIYGLGPQSKKAIIQEIRDERAKGYGPTPLNDVRLVWCESFFVRNSPALITFVETAS